MRDKNKADFSKGRIFMKSINYKGKLCLFVLLSIVCIMLFPATVLQKMRFNID